MKRSILCLIVLGIAGELARADVVTPIISEGIVKAPVESVWSAWTTSRGLRSWLAPHADVDLKIGGRMRANYHPDGALGDPRTIENTVLAFDPERMIAIQVARTPEGFPFPNAVKSMWTVVYLEPAGPDRTHVRIVGLGFKADEESQKMRAFFDRGNATTLEQLQRRFNQEADRPPGGPDGRAAEPDKE